MINRAVRHFVGAVAACSLFVAQAVVAYIGLFGYAVLTDAPLGSPIAGLTTMLLAIVLGAGLVPLLFLPASLVGEIATKRGRLSLKLLITIAVAATLASIYVAVMAVAAGTSAASTGLACLCGVAAVLGPTVVYVLVAHAMLRANPIR
ncbi:hypothetical protein [Salinispora cortesiana]|uniref:hypothetical protein n=1 Tax=Salinispora cortesiana TaxID=1305843 RepID=UPI00041D17AF|nr:hypothetical protein [Salinispora cortesiana]